MRLLKALDRDDRLAAIPYQKSGTAEAVELSVEKCRTAAWAVTPDGRKHRGAEAMNVSLSVVLGTPIPHGLYRLPLLGRLQDLAYDWVAANRRRLPGDEPYCSQRPNQCH